MNFWADLRKPIFALAPMDGVTDTVFRQIVEEAGKPDVFFTEFVSIDALCSAGFKKAAERLKFSKKEHPIVAQIWGTDPDKFKRSSEIIAKLGFDGIDINMGCPVADIIKTGACSALINNPKLATEIINAVIKGGKGLPVSVKTRIGFKNIDTENWVKTLLAAEISALTLHLRTASEMSKVPAHWDEITKAVKLRNKLNPKTLILGNGDVATLKEGNKTCKKYNIDGVMIGRAIFDNVWFFKKEVNIQKVTPTQKIEVLIKHLKLYKKTYQSSKHFALMKKFVKCYINNFEGATLEREKLMRCNNLAEMISTATIIKL